MSIVTFEKNLFVERILNPVSKIADNLLLDFSDQGFAKTIVNTSDNSVILACRVPCKAEGFTERVVIPDCKTFLRLFSGVENNHVSLKIESNAISYKDKSMSFKYHLLDESYIINKKAFNEEKLNQIKFDTDFVLTKQKLSEIIKFNSIVPDAEKLYFSTQEKNVLAKLGDNEKPNTNEITTEVCSEFSGSAMLSEFPVNIQNILLFSFNGNDVKVQVNQELKIFKFSIEHLSYIVSGLVK
jgi:hypothetical protein